MLVAAYALTMLVSAALLFVVQPMIAKLLLPSLGGSSAVWTTCMVFFQGSLVLGYCYAHLGARLMRPRTQASVHLPLMIAAALTLPFALPALDIEVSTQPTLWLLAALTLSVGFVFLVVSATAPLLQHWFAHTSHPDRDDPYFLYSASNLGSMAALLGYPLFVEPVFGVHAQTIAWAVGYGALVLLILVCAGLVWRAERSQPTQGLDAAALTWRFRARVLVLAAVPSSLMLGVTQYMTTDIASAPFLWVLPLALYLLTFILVFSRRQIRLPQVTRTMLPLATALVFSATALRVDLWISMALHLINFTLWAMFLHGLLADDRPPPARLTEYFVLLSLGGVLGGAFNALLAPAIFDRLVDYHLVMFATIAVVRPAQWRLDNPHGFRWLMPTFTAVASAFYLWASGAWALDAWRSVVAMALFVGALTAIAAFRPRLDNICFALVLAMGAQYAFATEGLVAYDRSFFAAYKVYEREYGEAGLYRKFSHGTTEHGAQSLHPDKASVPVSYHHPEGPVGQVLFEVPHRRVLVVGLGAGAMASYAGAHAHFDIFEIDPLVEEIAREHFTYLQLCGENCSVEIGDGRRLIAESMRRWDIIFLDAYNSDAVPTHLLTREAVQLYLEHLTEDGVLVFHVSNRYLMVESVVGQLAEDAGLVAYSQLHKPPYKERRAKQISPSKYTVVARTREPLLGLLKTGDWRIAWTDADLWTDDYTNVIGVIKW